MNPKLSIWSSYYLGLSPEEMVDEFIKNGIYCSELSDEHAAALFDRGNDIEKTAYEFAGHINDRNFEMSQGHLWLSCKMCTDPAALIILSKWIDMYEIIGVKNMVLHCDSMLTSNYSDEEKVERNIEKLKVLAERIENKDITICLENLCSITKSADELNYIIDEVGSGRFGICLDTGHLNVSNVQSQREFILKAGKRLRALHIANNDGTWDQHIMPFGRGNVDFAEVVAALREVDYKGLFNYEIPGENKVPMEMKAAKIKFIQAGYDYLMKA